MVGDFKVCFVMIVNDKFFVTKMFDGKFVFGF